MKVVCIILMVIVSIIFVGCNLSVDEDVVRIHIRANSNSVEDQGVKLKVRDKVVEFITPIIAGCSNSKDVKLCLEKNLNGIENVADDVLSCNGFYYSSNVRINNEYFPSREYNGNVFPADYYDALIIELGSGNGDNWWCVAYPPLCFVGYENETSGNIQYKSKLVELVNKYFGDR